MDALVVLVALGEERLHLLDLHLDVEEVLELVEQDADVLAEEVQLLELLHLAVEFLV